MQHQKLHRPAATSELKSIEVDKRSGEMSSCRNKSTAILIFTHNREQEAKSKSFNTAAGKKANRLIAGLLIGRSQKIARKTNYPVVMYTTDRQTGDNFGERFTNAFLELFQQGYQQVIAMGNDTPGLTSAHITQAIEQVDKGNAVLGPSLDGGTYLIGLSKDMFDARAFKNVAWQTSHVLKNLHALLTSNGLEIIYLEALHDIDYESDLTYLLKTSTINKIIWQCLGKIASILASFGCVYNKILPRCRSSVIPHLDIGRSPPAAVS